MFTEADHLFHWLAVGAEDIRLKRARYVPAAVAVYVFEVAPEIITPFRSH